MPGAAVEIAGLNKRYGEFVAVDDVSLSIEPGEFVTLLGLSGSGKTTTLMAVAGLTEPDSGTISIDGRDILSLPPEKRGLGVVFQNYALFPHLDVFDNIAFPLRMRKWAEADISKAVERVLKVVSLEQFSDRRISALSGGQQQRVALARALVFEPPVLLMDEPLGALDRSLRDQLQTEIKRIQREFGVTVIYVTHDQEEALALSDRIAVMANGKICQLGSPDEIYERPNTGFVAGFVGDSTRLPGRIAEFRGEDARVTLDAGGEVIGRVADGAGPGDAVEVFLRPEAMRVAAPGVEASLEGVVDSLLFNGANSRILVRLAGGQLIEVADSGQTADVAQGAPVAIAWAPERARIFRRAS